MPRSKTYLNGVLVTDTATLPTVFDEPDDALAARKAGGRATIALGGANSDALVKRVLSELAAFASWLNGAQGYVGEFGVSAAATDAAKWNQLLDIFYSACTGYGMHMTSWGTGKWLRSDLLGTSMQFYVSHTGGMSTIDAASQAALVSEKHPEIPGGGLVRGTNFAGLDWNPPRGAQITAFVPNLTDIQYLWSRGVRTIRLPSVWEKLQPTLGGALDSAEQTLIDGVLQACAQVGMKVILDCCHNAAYYAPSGGSSTALTRAGASPNAADLSDYWTRVVNWIKADANRNATVLAWDIMNEPAGLSTEYGTPTTTLWDFEDGTLQGWTTTSPTVTLSNDATISKNGTKSLQADVNTTSFNYFNINPPNDSYAGVAGISLWIWCPAGVTGASAYTTVFDTNSQGHPGDGINLTAGAWNKLTIPTNFGTGTHSIDIIVQSIPVATSTKFRFDFAQQMPVTYSPAGVWEQISQAVVTAIRATGDTRPITVPTYDYSQMQLVKSYHSAPWITDSANNIWYQVHSYWDRMRSGGYQSAANSAVAETYEEERQNAQRAAAVTYPQVGGPFTTGLGATAGGLFSSLTLDGFSSESIGSITGVVTGSGIPAGGDFAALVMSATALANFVGNPPRHIAVSPMNGDTASTGVSWRWSTDRIIFSVGNAIASGKTLKFSYLVVP